MKKIVHKTAEYFQFITTLKQAIQAAQIKASLAVNLELLQLYWALGQAIDQKQEQHGWGGKVIETLAQDLQKEFPGIGGFSRTNIFFMRAFYQAYSVLLEKENAIVQTPSGQLDNLPIFKISWSHNIILLTKLKDNGQRLWYAQQAIEHGWSSSVLMMHIESKRFERTGKAITNFKYTLPQYHSDMAQQALKDPYVFDFLTLQDQHLEKDIEAGLLQHVQDFLLELGEGFAFVAQQKHLKIGDDDFYLDLLFYHLQLRCFVVIELKAAPFKPEYAGQLSFYLAAVDKLLAQETDQPTIGLLLCKTKNNVTAEYAVNASSKPIGIAQYETKILKSLPKEFKGKLPTIEVIEAELKRTIFRGTPMKRKRTVAQKGSKKTASQKNSKKK